MNMENSPELKRFIEPSPQMTRFYSRPSSSGPNKGLHQVKE